MKNLFINYYQFCFTTDTVIVNKNIPYSKKGTVLKWNRLRKMKRKDSLLKTTGR